MTRARLPIRTQQHGKASALMTAGLSRSPRRTLQAT